jgi:hypothetical protein
MIGRPIGGRGRRDSIEQHATGQGADAVEEGLGSVHDPQTRQLRAAGGIESMADLVGGKRKAVQRPQQ